ncbi:hypothetical protein C8R43DRAFT_1012726 [Mycena crocata]|nr:hypothetical protein C8R43DRAFT_1012726 [Mycena crocata]
MDQNPTTPLSPLAPYPPIPSPEYQSCSPEFYGFVAWTSASFLSMVCLHSLRRNHKRAWN